MKFLFSLATLFFLTGSCNSQKESITNSNTSNLESIKEKEMITNKQNTDGQNNDLGIIYEARSRGYVKSVYISKAKVRLSQDQSQQKMAEYSIDDKVWKEFEKLIEGIERKTFENLKAPTDKRLFDGAAHTTLSIKQGETLYMTPSFDEGFPPKEIEELVNKVLALAEKVKKQ